MQTNSLPPAECVVGRVLLLGTEITVCHLSEVSQEAEEGYRLGMVRTVVALGAASKGSEARVLGTHSGYISSWIVRRLEDNIRSQRPGVG